MSFFSKQFKDNLILMFSKVFFSKYGLTILIFGVWISFFDGHNLISQQKLKSTIQTLKLERSQYEKMIVEAKLERLDLEKNREKYAREKYYMHKENENVFIILNDETKK